MAHPYRESYVDEVAETQGALFDRLQDETPMRTAPTSFVVT